MLKACPYIHHDDNLQPHTGLSRVYNVPRRVNNAAGTLRQRAYFIFELRAFVKRCVKCFPQFVTQMSKVWKIKDKFSRLLKNKPLILCRVRV